MPVLNHLRALVDAQLVNPVSAEAFAFRHTLTREAVYSTLLKRQRAAYHALVADTLEDLYGMEALQASQAADLAYHYREAANWPKALEYAQRAGEQAQKRYAPHEAAEHFSNALEAARQLDQPLDLDLLRHRGQAYETLGEFERARADYELGLRRARQTGETLAEWQALLDLGILWAGRDYARTGEYFQQALALARAGRDPLIVARSLNRVGNWLANTGRAMEGLQQHHAALEIFRQQGVLAEMAATYDLLGLGYTFIGDIRAALEQTRQALELFRHEGDKRGLISSLIAHSALITNCDTLPWTSPPLEICRQEAAEALALARQIGLQAGQAEAQWLHGLTLASFGEFGEALAQVKSGLRAASDIEHREWMAAAQCALGQIHFELLQPETAARHLGQAQQLALELGSGWWISYTSAYVALNELQLSQPRTARAELEQAAAALGLAPGWPARAPRNLAERCLAWAWGETALADGQPAEALAVAERLLASAINPANEPIPNLLKLKAEALMALGQPAEAQAPLDQALTGARAQQAQPTLWQIHGRRGQLAQRLGQSDTAQLEIEAARSGIAALAGSLDDEPLKQQFVERALRRLNDNGAAGQTR